MSEDIKSLKPAQLRKLAEEQGIAGWEDMDKKQLIAALSAGEIEKEKDEDEDETDEDDESEDIKSSEPSDAPTPKSKPSFVSGKVKFVGFTEIAPGLHAGPVAVGSKAENMKNFLASQKSIRIMIPLEAGEKPGKSTKSVTLNGYVLHIEKGAYVEVPEAVADVVMESEKQTVAATNLGGAVAGENSPGVIEGSGPSALN